MSLEAGLAAVYNRPYPYVPRTEYSAANHWELVQTVTGIDTSIIENRLNAQKIFFKKWNYSFQWGAMVHTPYLEEHGGRYTKLGHASYMESTHGKSDLSHTQVNPFRDPEDALALKPLTEYGTWAKEELTKRFEAHYKSKQDLSNDAVVTTGTYITLISGLNEIYGFEDMCMAMATDIDRFNKVVEEYVAWMMQFFEAFAASSIPYMMVHDDICWTSGPFAQPAWYRENVFPNYKKLFAPLKKAGKKIVYTSDGTIDMFYDDLVDCGIDMLVMEPTNNMRDFAERHGDKVGFIGGCDCRTLMGDKAGIKKEVEEVMSYAKKYNGFIFATGNHIPPNVPVENAIYYNELYEQLKWR